MRYSITARRRLPREASHRRRSPARGGSLLEVLVALLLSLLGISMVGPALTLSLTILTEDQRSLDQEMALEAAWNAVCAEPPQFLTSQQRDINVGDNRTVNVKITPLDDKDGLRRWRLWVDDPSRADERWIAR